MGTSSNITQLCREMVHSHGSSLLQVEANGVRWKVFIRNGQLQYAINSLQNIDSLAHHLNRLGHALPVAVRESLTYLIESKPWDVVLWHAVEHLEKDDILETAASKAVKLALSEDALESLLWLPEAEYSSDAHQADYADLVPLATSLDGLESRLRSWQQLQPMVKSPYQQISCPDAARLNQPVTNGKLNQSLLLMLAPLMQGTSIYQVTTLLKQDSLKVAQLLYPYIQQQVFVLSPPIFPLDKLPNIPQGESSQSPGGASSQAMISQAMQKIVCIDDSPAMLDTLRKYLEAEGFDVATLENPMESMSVLFSMKPDMILMDVSMPGINGRRLCEILRRSSAFKNLPIIIVSSNTSVLEKAKAESSGATDYLQKPFSKAELLTIVKSYLKVAAPV